MDIKKIAIIGGSILGAGTLAYLLLRSSKSATATASTNGQALSRDTVLVVLKSLKKELFTVVL